MNDALSFKKFLTKKLRVPDSHIVFLSNEFATRDSIITTFQKHLIENITIERGDAIIIFYAGHGGRVDAPEGWISTDGKIETICPRDEWAPCPHDNTCLICPFDDASRRRLVCGIPDRTINALLRRLADAKGDNVVSDQCRKML